MRPEATVGNKAPDFVATDLLSKKTSSPHQWLGRPILMIFYAPNSLTAEPVLRFGQQFAQDGSSPFHVLGLAVTEDADTARRQHADLRLTFPVLTGTGLRQSYAVEATPKLVILDGQGIVRGQYVGWGPETPEAVARLLTECLTGSPARLPSGDPQRKSPAAPAR